MAKHIFQPDKRNTIVCARCGCVEGDRDGVIDCPDVSEDSLKLMRVVRERRRERAAMERMEKVESAHLKPPVSSPMTYPEQCEPMLPADHAVWRNLRSVKDFITNEPLIVSGKPIPAIDPVPIPKTCAKCGGTFIVSEPVVINWNGSNTTSYHPDCAPQKPTDEKAPDPANFRAERFLFIRAMDKGPGIYVDQGNDGTTCLSVIDVDARETFWWKISNDLPVSTIANLIQAESIKRPNLCVHVDVSGIGASIKELLPSRISAARTYVQWNYRVRVPIRVPTEEKAGQFPKEVVRKVGEKVTRHLEEAYFSPSSPVGANPGLVRPAAGEQIGFDPAIPGADRTIIMVSEVVRGDNGVQVGVRYTFTLSSGCAVSEEGGEVIIKAPNGQTLRYKGPR